VIDARVLGGALRITVGGEGVYIFDLEGRPVFFEHEFRSYERGLSGLLVRKSRRDGRRIVEEIVGDERESALRSVYGAARKALDASRGGGAEEALRLTVSRGIHWLREDELRFASLYMPISILPPDQYLSVVLQATVGCAYNRCSFCFFYRDRAYRAKDPREFEAHSTLVKEWLGAGAMIRRGIFLADANPLGAPREYVPEYVRIAREQFPGRDVYAFADYFSTRLESSDYSRMASLGLRRVYMGLESGSRDVLRLLNKPADPGLAVEMARRLGDAGVSRGVIVLVGAGGRKLWRDHVEGTVGVLSAMNLGKDDIVFLSRLFIRPDMPYALATRDVLDQLGMDEQEGELITALRDMGLRPAPYDIRESIY